MLAISSLSVGCKNIVLLVSFERWSEKCLCEYFIFAAAQRFSGNMLIQNFQKNYFREHFRIYCCNLMTLKSVDILVAI